jgi:hypothetical protein
MNFIHRVRIQRIYRPLRRRLREAPWWLGFLFKDQPEFHFLRFMLPCARSLRAKA